MAMRIRIAIVEIIAERGPSLIRSCHFGLNTSMESPSAMVMTGGSTIPCMVEMLSHQNPERKEKPATTGWASTLCNDYTAYAALFHLIALPPLSRCNEIVYAKQPRGHSRRHGRRNAQHAVDLNEVVDEVPERDGCAVVLNLFAEDIRQASVVTPGSFP